MLPESLLAFVHAHQSFLILGHQEPDADCIGSQLALGSFLSRSGKSVRQYSHGPFKRPEVNGYAPQFETRIDPFERISKPGVIVVDCSSVDRIGDLKNDLGDLSVAVIDHHATPSRFGTVRWVDSNRSSCTGMVLDLIRALGGTPTAEEAHLLFLGLATDTGFFRHLEAQSQTSFESAAYLSQNGASAKAVFQQINGGKLFANQKLMGLVISRAESHFDGRVVFSWEELGDRGRLGAENRESDQIYQTFQGVPGVEVIVLLRQDTAETVTGGLRSKSWIDVAALAQQFGGGGHVRASGFSCAGTVAEVKARIFQILDTLIA